MNQSILTFLSVLVSPDALPRFWIFMYRATPLSYYVSGIMSTGISGVEIVCTPADIANIPSVPSGETCASYLSTYIDETGVQLLNGDATSNCEICPWGNTDTLLATYGIYYSERWRNFGITLAYIGFNVAATYALWYLVKIPRGKKA